MNILMSLGQRIMACGMHGQTFAISSSKHLQRIEDTAARLNCSQECMHSPKKGPLGAQQSMARSHLA
jgi:hypothetical protein